MDNKSRNDGHSGAEDGQTNQDDNSPASSQAAAFSSTLNSTQIPDSYELKSSDNGTPYYEFTESPITKSQSDNRNYRLIKLTNGLIALLGQDLKENKSCAAMNVKVGSISDPPEYMGLAHFCEHMLFMGTEKYPEENEYSKYLSMHGGHSNAYTDTENTCYYFDISQENFEGALDRFAQFFISPLFTSDCTEREVKAVDSEFKKNIQNDWWRLHQLEKSLLDENHPYSQFSSGNYETLIESAKSRGEDLRDELIKFYDKYYSSDIMRLVVVGKENLNDLANWVTNKFSDIKSKGVTYKSPENHPLTKDCLGKLIVTKSIRDNRYLKLVFPFPDSQAHYKTKPAYYLTNLIGHESEGSILSCLKAKGWATEIVASYGSSFGGDFGAFKILVSLTESGIENYKNIIHIIFAYIKLVKKAGPQEWYFNELMKTSQIDFRFEEKRDVISFATNVSTNLHQKYYPPQSVISGPSLLYEFNPEPISERIDMLRADNYRVLLSTNNPKLSNPNKEKFYGVEYEVSDLSNDLLDGMEKAIDSLSEDVIKTLHNPHPNKFIPENLEIKNRSKHPEPALKPSLVLKNEQLELWFKQDDRFDLPRGIVNLAINVPGIYSSPLNSLLSSLYTDIFYDQTKEITYDAKVAGFRFALNTSFDVIDVVIEGYNDKLIDLVTVLLQNMKNLEITQERYDICLDEVVRRLENHSHSEPWSQAGLAYNYFKVSTQWRYTDKLAASKKVTIEHMRQFTQSLFNQAYFQILVLGNYIEQDAVDISSVILNTFQSTNYLLSERVFNRTVKYPSGQYSFFTKSHSEKNLNSSVMRLVYAASPFNHYERALLGLVSSIVQESFFDQVRTKEQLGYIVTSQCNIMNDSSLCLLFLVQSESNPSFVDLRISSFIENYTTVIKNLSPLQLDKYIRALINKRETKPKYIREEAMKFWHQIKSGYYEFKWSATDISYLQMLSVDDVIGFWNKYINLKSELASHLSIRVYSSFYQIPEKHQIRKYPSTLFALEGCLIHKGGDSEIVSKNMLVKCFSTIARSIDLEIVSGDTIKQVIDTFTECYTQQAEKKIASIESPDSQEMYKSKNAKFIKALKEAESSTEHINIAFAMALEEFTEIVNLGAEELPRTPEPSSGPYLVDESDSSVNPNVDSSLSNPNTIKEKFNLARGLIKTPNNTWVFLDPVKFKYTSELAPGPISYHDLKPKLG